MSNYSTDEVDAKAREMLEASIENHGLVELMDCLTSNHADFNEFEANIWEYVKSEESGFDFILNRYKIRFAESIMEELDSEFAEMMDDKKRNPEGW